MDTDTNYCPICNQYIGYLPKSCDYKKLQYINQINQKSKAKGTKDKKTIY